MTNITGIFYKTCLVLIAFVFISFNQNQNKFEINLSNSQFLKEAKNFNNLPYDKDSIIVIFTYLECPPCLALAKKLNSKFNKSKYQKRIIYYNIFNNDSARISQYLSKSKTPFPYLVKPFYIMEGSYPLICFYNNKGQLVNKIEGFGLGTLREIKKFLN